MSHFYCNLFPLVLGLIDLADRSRSDRHWVELLEDLLDCAAIRLFEILESNLVRVCGYIFPKVLKFICELRSYDVSAVT